MNPVLQRVVGAGSKTTPAGYPQMDGYQVGGSPQAFPPAGQPYGQQPYAGQPYAEKPYAGQQPGQQFPAPQTPDIAGSGVGRAVTWDDIFLKTAATFGVLFAGAAGGYFALATLGKAGIGLVIGAGIAAFVLGLVNSFKRQPSPMLILLYSAAEGVMLGGISTLFAAAYGGVVGKAILATLVTFAVMLGLYKAKIVRNSSRLMKIVLIGSIAYGVFLLVNLGVTMFAGSGAAPGNIMVFGMPLWVIASMLAVVLAAFSLVTDFDFIETAVENRADASVAWSAAFGLMVTLVWLYIEFLRLFAYFASSD